MLTDTDRAALLALGDNWIVRTDNDGKSYNGFRWAPVGEWTWAPDWKDTDECGYGLHGQGPDGYGYAQSGTRFVFCETSGPRRTIDGNKIKVQRARILYTGSQALAALVFLCPNFPGSLDLRGCDLTGIALPQTVGGWLNLSGCDLAGVTLPRVGGEIYK